MDPQNYGPDCILGHDLKVLSLLLLFRVLKLFPRLGTDVVKHYIIVVVHRSFPQGVVSLVILRDCFPMNVRIK